jgi:hypothetical protein
MEQASARIVLDRSDATFSPGEPIRGHLVMTGEPAAAVAEGVIGLQWSVVGQAAADEGPRICRSLEASAVSGGDTLPFELSAPGGPFTHGGTLFSIGWTLVAALRTTDGQEIEVGAPIVVQRWGGGGDAPRAGRPRVPYDHGPDHGKPTDAERMEAARPHGRLIGGAVILVSAVATGLSFALAQPFLGAVLGAMTVLCCALYVAGLVQQRGAIRLGEPEIFIEPSLVRPGGTFDVRVLVRPSSRIRLDSARAVLEGYEYYRTGARTTGRAGRHDLCHAEVVLLAEPHDVGSSEELILSGRFVLPTELPPTFSHPTYAIRYKLLVEVTVAGTRSWARRRTITVSPDGAWRPDTP